jgi:hypothetical protein
MDTYTSHLIELGKIGQSGLILAITIVFQIPNVPIFTS